MKPAAAAFGGQLKALREAAGYTQEELATIAGLSVHAVSALERGERRRPQAETVRALSAALDLTGAAREALLASARAPAHGAAVDELSGLFLPLPPTVLLGREAEVATLRQWLADPAARIITLLGPGGVGKTRLALELARAMADAGETRVVFASLAAVRDSALVAPTIAEALGLTDVLSGDLPKRARAACRHHPTLIVLDNFEHVLDAAPLIADLLTVVASLRVLVTSRAPLRLRGEREYAIGPLSLAEGSEALSPADLARTPAVQLLMERVRDVEPGFRLTTANAATVTAICRRLDALPLALELAAPWMKVLTPEGLLRRLDQDTPLVTIGARDLPERQQTMNATVAWSYHLLAAHEQRAFWRFGALRGSYSADAAAAVLAGRNGMPGARDAALTALAGLMDKSLLIRTETSVSTRPLYHMLETVRAYAVREATTEAERDDALEGLVLYCRGEAALAASGLIGHGQVDWLNRVREDLDSYRDALTWLIERARPAEAAEIASGLKFFWLIRGHGPEGLRWYEQILSMPSLPPAAECHALVGAALMCYTQGEVERARAANQRALGLATQVGNLGLVAEAEMLLGHVEHVTGNLSVAGDRFRRSLDEFRALSISWGTGYALYRLAELALESDDDGDAERLVDEAALVLRDAGPWFLSLGSFIRAILAIRRRAPDEAVALVRESLARIRELQDTFAFAYTLVPLAAAAVLKGDDAWAARVVGVRDAVIEGTGVRLVGAWLDDLREQVERHARARLGEERWARAYEAGCSASIDALLHDIDRALGAR
jgi:predicted ATPase/DNA-binding XRE family transcriptional regulator